MRITWVEVFIVGILLLGWMAFACYSFANAGERVATKRMQKEALQRGFAEYNSTNGVWQWKGSK